MTEQTEPETQNPPPPAGDQGTTGSTGTSSDPAAPTSEFLTRSDLEKALAALDASPAIAAIEKTFADLYSEIATLKAARAPTSAPAAAPKPSPSRIVIFRDGTGNEYPAVITRVYPETGAVALFVFRDDSNSTHSYGAQMQIDPSSEGQLGWFWPPRT